MKLAELCTNIVDREHKTAPIQEKGIPSIRTTDISNGFIDFKNCNKVSEKTYRAWTARLEPKAGDVILAREAPVGQVGMIPEEQKACLGQRTVLLRANPKRIRPYYLLYLLLSRELQHKMKVLAAGSTVEHLNMSDIRALELPEIPPLQTQDRISKILLNLDQKTTLLHQQNETLEQIAQALFKRWFVELEFPYDFDRGVPSPDGKPYKSAGGKMVPSELGEIPEGWRVGKIGEQIKILGGGTPSTKQATYWSDGHINWYTPSDLTNNDNLFSLGSERRITEKGLSESSATLFPSHSLMMTSRATIGEIAINSVEACTNQGFIVLIPNENYRVHFLHNWLKTQMRLIRRLASGSTFPELGRTVFKRFDILQVPVEVMTLFSEVLSPVYKKIENNIWESKALMRTRDSLLPKLMSGQIRVGQKTRHRIK